MIHRIWLVVLVLCLPVSAWGQTEYYVDPDATTSDLGTAANPWLELDSAAWSTIDTELGANPVTVYFSAREAGSDTNQTSTDQLNIERDDTGANALILDGKSQYNTSDASPSWSAYAGSSRHQITHALPIRTNNRSSPYEPRHNFTVQGFDLFGTSKCIEVANVQNGTFDDIDAEHTPPAGSPCFQLDPYAATNSGTVWSDTVTLKNSDIGPTEGECIYINGHKTEASEGAASSDNVTIENNTIHDCGEFGSEGDGIDVKDGVQNLIIRDNTIWNTYNQGMIIDGGGLIDSNHVYTTGLGGGDGMCLALVVREATFVNRTNAQVINNLFVNCGANDEGIQIRGPNQGDVDEFINLLIANNTVVDAEGAGFECCGNIVGTSEPQDVVLRNNIFWNNNSSSVQISVEACTPDCISAHSNNLVGDDAQSGTVASIDGTSYTHATFVSSYEATAVTTDPIFAGSTYATDTNWKISSGSPAEDAATDLSGTFTVDYFDVTRSGTWDIGFHELASTLEITSTSQPAGTVNMAYSDTLVAVGGTAPYTWDTVPNGETTLLDSDAECAGLSVSSGGVVSGTPTTAGTCSWTAEVTDDVAATDTQALTITVNPASTGGGRLRVRIR